MTDGRTPFYRQDRVGRTAASTRCGSCARWWWMPTPGSRPIWPPIPPPARNGTDPEAEDRSAHHPGRPRSCARPRSTNCRSCGTCSRGDMSLVGPRPMMPEQQALYPGRAYYALRPGITGPWQVSERNDTTFADRARLRRGLPARAVLADRRRAFWWRPSGSCCTAPATEPHLSDTILPQAAARMAAKVGGNRRPLPCRSARPMTGRSGRHDLMTGQTGLELR